MNRIMKNAIFFDCEVYQNYFLVIFKNNDNYLKKISIFGSDTTLSDSDKKSIINIIYNNTIIGFNSKNYDLKILNCAINNYSCLRLYQLSKDIIDNKDIYIPFGNNKLNLTNHFDLINIAPGYVGLKMFGARLNSTKLQDLPIEPDKKILENQIKTIEKYCENDINITIDLYNALKNQVNIRENMSTEKVNYRCSSDSTIAEIYFKNIFNTKGLKNTDSNVFKYTKPEYIKFESDKLKKLVSKLENHTFVLSNNQIKIPDFLSIIGINGVDYKLGVGGLHSLSEYLQFESDDQYIIIDKDVTSYYPNIIKNNNIYPNQLGNQFNVEYEKLIDQRVKAKKDGNKDLSNFLKIVINSCYGKFNSQYSILCSPKSLIDVTITGQLSLLMLIETLTMNNIDVISANTDGITCKVPRDIQFNFESLCFDWQLRTNFTLEPEIFDKIVMNNINNYFGLKKDGSIKRKGCYSDNYVSKNPDGPIIYEAIIQYFLKNTPVKDTIENCKDIKQFLFVRKVNNGAESDQFGKLGKSIRWYYSKNGDQFYFNKNNIQNKVPKAGNSVPILDLNNLNLEKYPIFHQKYVDECNKLIDNFIKLF